MRKQPAGIKRKLPKGVLVDRGYVFIRIFRNGKPFREGFGKAVPSNINTAIAKLNEYRLSIHNEKFDFEDKAKRVHVKDAAQLIIDRGVPKSYVAAYNRLVQFTEDCFYDLLSPLRMSSYREWAKANVSVKRRNVETGEIETFPLSDSSINYDLTAFSSMYYRLKGLVEDHQLPALKLPAQPICRKVERFDERISRRKRHLDQDELVSFLSVATPRVQRLCVGALNTVLRKKDLLALIPENRVAGNGQIETMQHKVSAYVATPDNSNTRALFESAFGERVLDDTNFRREFERSRKVWLEGFPKEEWKAKWFMFMDLRRTALRKVYDETKDILLCQELAGHSSPETTRRYLGVSKFDISRAGQVLQKAFTFELPVSEANGTVVKTVGSEKKIGFKTNDND